MTSVVVGIVLLVINGFFVAAEFATIAARQTKLEILAERGSRRAQLALEATRRIQLQLAGAQLGITMASLGLGYFFEPFVDHQLEKLLTIGDALPHGLARPAAFVLSLLIVVFLHSVLGELVPKNLAISAPEATLMAVAIPYRGFLTVCRPVLVVLTAIAGAGARLLGVQPRSQLEVSHSPSDIAAMVDASGEEGLIEPFAHGLLAGVLDLDDRTAAEVMVPWAKTVVVSPTASVAEIEAVAARVGHSRIPIAAAGGGAPSRFVHTKDLLQVPLAARGAPLSDGAMRALVSCRPDDTLADVLAAMRRARVHVTVVMDGATPVGLVTLEDVLEELVGEIRDETDVDGP